MHKFATQIYQRLPSFLQNAAISAYGYQWKKRRFGGIFEQEVLAFKTREQFDRVQWEAYQTGELRKIVLHAYQHVPHYRQAFSANNIAIEQIRSFSLKDLAKLPILSKQDLRQFGRTKLLSEVIDKKGSFFASSGSTGTPVEIYFSYIMHQRYNAMVEARCRNWAGLTYKDARGMIGGRRIVPDGALTGPFHRYNVFEKQVYLSAYHISPKTASDYLNALKKYKVQYMVGYAMSNYLLANLLQKMHLKVPAMKAVITSSEKLTPEMRATLAETYQCRVYDSYSGVEACSAITECEHGSLHVNPDIGIIEFINDKGENAVHGEHAEMVVTGLLNLDQPLIRYKTGDFVVMDERTCPCGRQMPVIQEIIGRMEDTVIGLDGREMVRFHGIFVNIPSIIEGQIIQHDYTDFEICIVSAVPLTTEERTLISQRMQSQLGTIKLTISEVAHIPRGANGKFKAVISHVKREDIPAIRTQI